MVEVALDSKQDNLTWLSMGEDEARVGHFHYRLARQSHKWRPPTDVYETEDAILIKVEIAGMQEKDFSIILNKRSIVIQGSRQDQEPKRAFHQMEIRGGEFSTEIQLQWPIDTEKVQAEYKDGFLRITLPKAKTHQIEIDE